MSKVECHHYHQFGHRKMMCPQLYVGQANATFFLSEDEQNIIKSIRASQSSLEQFLSPASVAYSEKQIIHRDVKSSNIILTERMRAKVADFGFARLGDTEPGKTHVLTKVRGTVGYLDPEYLRTYQLTPKSDVYSFGILLVEILTGRRPVESRRPPEEKVTIRWAFAKYNEGEAMDLVDPQMREAVDKEIFGKMLSLAFQCAAPTRADRPDMKSVGEQLWAIRMDYLRHGTRE